MLPIVFMALQAIGIASCILAIRAAIKKSRDVAGVSIGPAAISIVGLVAVGLMRGFDGVIVGVIPPLAGAIISALVLGLVKAPVEPMQPKLI